MLLVYFTGGLLPHLHVASVTEGFFEGGFVGCLKDVILNIGGTKVVFSSLLEGRNIKECSTLSWEWEEILLVFYLINVQMYIRVY